MPLEKLIQQLKRATCTTREERENVATNIKICEMQIEIRDKNIRREKHLKGKR